MSTEEILAQLPELKPDEREQVLEKLCKLQEADILHGREPEPFIKKLLDDALAEFQHDENPGAAWREVLSRLSKKPR